MSTIEEIRLFDGRLIGTIETEPNGNQLAREFPSGQVLGYYIKCYNRTTDFYGRVLVHGNAIQHLLFLKNKYF